MLDAIANAKREIVLEMYWFDSDRIGTRFADALIERAQSGVAVRVVYDAFGSFGVEDTFFDGMRAAGVSVAVFNPLSAWGRHFSFGRLNRRNHRKILVVDGHVGFTGGINIADRWASVEDGGEGWRDDVVRIEGPAALRLRDVVYDLWARFDKRLERELMTAPALPEGESYVRVVANEYRADRRAIRAAYLQQIRAATRSIYISNCYFVPDPAIRRALGAAAKRGVDVRVITAGNSDVPTVRYASRARYAWLMKRGVRIYEWSKTVFHSKTAVVDDVWCTVGTYNLDYRSWRFNLEVNVAIADASLGHAMRDAFLVDMDASVRIDERAWRARPVFEKLLEWMSYAVRKLL
jgi:cardiolipin synthase